VSRAAPCWSRGGTPPSDGSANVPEEAAVDHPQFGHVEHPGEERAHEIDGLPHHGLHPDAPEPSERVVTVVPNGRLVGSVLLSGTTPGCALAAVGFTTILPATARHITSAGQGDVQVTLTRLSDRCGRRAVAAPVVAARLHLAESGDGIRSARYGYEDKDQIRSITADGRGTAAWSPTSATVGDYRPWGPAAVGRTVGVSDGGEAGA
jgi:hypothetical protein